MDDINEATKKLNISLATLSYPVLEGLNYFRDYNKYIENSLNDRFNEVNAKLENKEGTPRALNLELIKALSDKKMYNAFGNIMRVSLLTAVYSYIENIITTSCVIEGRKGKYNTYKQNQRNTEGKSAIVIAKDFLVKEGFSELINIVGWKYLDDMREIRNRFVHSGGKVNSKVRKISNSYDFSIENEEIVLEQHFIINFINLIENFSVKFVEVVYPKQDTFLERYKKIFENAMNNE